RPASAAAVRERLRHLAVAPPEPAAGGSPSSASTARRTRRLDRSRFVGRAQPLETLKTAVESALAGQGGVVLVSGEAGIGKSRLAEEAGVYARLRGAQVLVAACHEPGPAVPYIPF